MQQEIELFYRETFSKEIMTGWVDEYMTMVEDCEQRESRLTEWEASFIDSIKDQLGRERPLSTKQIETLEKVWDRATKKG